MFQVIAIADFCQHGTVDMNGRFQNGRFQFFCPCDEWAWRHVWYDAPAAREATRQPKRDVGEEARRKIREIFAS